MRLEKTLLDLGSLFCKMVILDCSYEGSYPLVRRTGVRKHRQCRALRAYRGTSLIRERTLLGPYSRPMPMALWGSLGGGLLLMGEVPLYRCYSKLRSPF